LFGHDLAAGANGVAISVPVAQDAVDQRHEQNEGADEEERFKTHCTLP
jgi:hypothetical protein